MKVVNGSTQNRCAPQKNIAKTPSLPLSTTKCIILCCFKTGDLKKNSNSRGYRQVDKKIV